MTAINESVNDFMKQTIKKINEIAVESKNKIEDIISTVMLFCSKMMDIAKNALKTISKGVVIAFVLPFILAFSIYKGVLKVCKTLVEKVKDGVEIVKDAFNNIKTSISEWVSESLKEAKDTLISAGKSVKDGVRSSVKAIGKAYLSIVAVLGQLASDAKDEISEAYKNFTNAINDFSDDVKEYVSEKWNIVSNWCKKTSTSFAEGVKTVWGKVKEKVIDAIGSANAAYKTLEDNAESTWNDIKGWADEKQKDFLKANVKYAIDKWGKDEVSSWLDKN
jgi:phage-related protein